MERIASHDFPRYSATECGHFSNRACNVGEFFKGWRRKAGLVTLVMACVLAVAWMRSIFIEDILFIEYRHFDAIVFSDCGFVSWYQTLDPANNQSGPIVIFESTEIVVDYENRDSFWRNRQDTWRAFHDDDIDWRRGWAGVSFGAGIEHGPKGAIHHFKMLAVNYWSLVLPLTLLSAWLLLIKPRPAKSAKESSRA